MEKLASLSLLLSMTAAAGGCGGGSSTAADRLAGYPAGPTRQFVIPGGDNRVQVYGREATPRERRGASATIHRWMRARAAKDFATDCRYLSKRVIKNIVTDSGSATGGRVDSCVKALTYLGHSASGDYTNTLGNHPIVSFRVGSGFGYAQYHGRDGEDWIVPMNREEGKWLVGLPSPARRGG